MTSDFTKLITALTKLPGIGKKSATRLSYFLLKNKDKSKEIFLSIVDSLNKINNCSICGNFSSSDPCEICSSSNRDKKILCVVEEPSDLLAIEETGCYKGQYHILMGNINPLEGKGPDNLRIGELLKRSANEKFEEILIATNPTIEGESTFLYLQNLLADQNVKISKIATGIPMGGSLEYADKYTLGRAIQSKNYI